MQSVLDKAAVLVEALPYIRSFYGKTVVIKYGGAAMAAANLKDAVMQDVALMKFVGMNPVVVHGGGPDLSAAMKKSGREPQFIDGLRVTDAETMDLVQMVLVGRTNREIVTALSAHGGRAVGLAGQDAGLIQATRRLHRQQGTGQMVDLGYVGDVAQVNTSIIETLMADGFIPVIAPVGLGPDGHAYNINADTVAGEVAAALKAEKLVLLTDVEGIRSDRNDPRSLVGHLSRPQVQQWIQDGQLAGGMIPKVEACLRALDGGVRRVHIIDGRVPHALLMEIFTDRGVGTMITP